LKTLFADRQAEAVRAESPGRLEDVLHATAHHPGPLWWLDAGLPMAPEVRVALLDRYRVDTVFAEDGLSAVLFTPDSIARVGTALHHGPAGNTPLHPGSPWTAAYRISAKELVEHGPGSLVVNVAYASHGRPDAVLVIERRRGERITDYETFPLPLGGPVRTMHQAYVVRNLRELRHTGEEVGVYAWDRSADTLIVSDLRVRAVQRDLEHW
jgi:hypothetical protein